MPAIALLRILLPLWGHRSPAGRGLYIVLDETDNQRVVIDKNCDTGVDRYGHLLRIRFAWPIASVEQIFVGTELPIEQKGGVRTGAGMGPKK